MFLRKRPKRRNRAEKSTSKILVNGFILARVNRKTKPEVVYPVFFQPRRAWVRRDFLHENQQDTAKRRRLTRPQGAFAYHGRNKEKKAKTRELA
jgi:hypothetical protein